MDNRKKWKKKAKDGEEENTVDLVETFPPNIDLRSSMSCVRSVWLGKGREWGVAAEVVICTSGEGPVEGVAGKRDYFRYIDLIGSGGRTFM